MCEFTQDSWKMYRYTLEERVFIVRTYWKRKSIKSSQQQFLENFGGRHPPSKSSIWALSKKLETKGTLLDEHTGGRPKMSEEKINWQGISKIWRAGFNPVWTQMVATSSTCYDVTFLIQQTYSCSNFVRIYSLVLELLKKCRVR